MAKLPCDEVSVAKLLRRSYHVAKLLATVWSLRHSLAIFLTFFIDFGCKKCCLAFYLKVTAQASHIRDERGLDSDPGWSRIVAFFVGAGLSEL